VSWALAALLCGCASAPTAPPAPSTLPAPPAVEPSELERTLTNLSGRDLPLISPTLPELPYVEPAVTLTPSVPREGDAIGVYLSAHAPGASLAYLGGVEGEMAGTAVRFGPAGDGWFGMAAAPVGSAGAAELAVRYAAGGGEGWETVLLTPLIIQRRDFPSRQLSVASRYSNPPADVLSRIEREREQIRSTLAVSTPQSYLDGNFRWPRRARVTAGFGQRRIFNGELQSRHWGLDLSGRTGEPVRATARGRVALTGNFYFAGNAVFVDHGLGVFTGYFHLSRIRVAPGDFVERGQLLGDVGATGRVTASHLHWSLYVDGHSLDASSLLEIDVPDSAVPTRLERATD
jgi:murein DD-endopeptidase MepM/ murein hydrolase activator NlpD